MIALVVLTRGGCPHIVSGAKENLIISIAHRFKGHELYGIELIFIFHVHCARGCGQEVRNLMIGKEFLISEELGW